MNLKKGFTLIELMVVIVIIGILAALAIPKMLGISAKAKVAEAPSVVANWETLQSAYNQETGVAGTTAQIGFSAPTSTWWSYPATATVMTATAQKDMSTCLTTNILTSTYTAATDTFAKDGTAGCKSLVPNFK